VENQLGRDAGELGSCKTRLDRDGRRMGRAGDRFAGDESYLTADAFASLASLLTFANK
jgi:hypothetical protein